MGDLPSKKTPIIYFLTVRLVKLGLSLFFQSIEVRHRENLPEQGPAIFASNHPNSTMDALVISTVTPRMVHHIGHAGLFSRRLKAWILRNCGVIPVRRRQGISDAPDRNISSFESCFEVLAKGGAISIFPEGVSDKRRLVKQIKTGAARIVLEAEQRKNYHLGVQLIPIGLHFFSRSRFRSKVLVNVGRGLNLEPFFSLNEKDSPLAVKQLTEALQIRLEDLTINIKHPELEEFIRDLEIIYRDELKSGSITDPKARKKSAVDFVLSQKIVDCVEYYYQHDPRLVESMQEKVLLYRRKLKRCHLKDTVLREKQSAGKLLRQELANILQALIGLPLAGYGIINNFIPYRITEYLGKRYLAERTKVLTALFLGGAAAFLFFYAFQIFAVWWSWGGVWASLYFVSLPLSGFFALAYLRKIRRERERISFSFFLFTKRHLVGKMRYARKRLIAELDRLKDEYVSLTQNTAEKN